MPSFKTASRVAISAPRSARYTKTASLDAARVSSAFSNGNLEKDTSLPAAINEASEFEVASEAIVVVDIVQSTFSTNLFGWHSVGRVVTRDLRRMTREACAPFGLTSARTTGDGLLLTFSDGDSAAMAVPSALAGVQSLLARIRDRNSKVPEQHRLDVRTALHFGEVDIIEDVREGPNVVFACRLEKVSKVSLPLALNPMDPRSFPSANYVICSEAVAEVLDQVGEAGPRTSCGLFKMKGFLGWWEVFLLEPAPNVKAVPRLSGGA